MSRSAPLKEYDLGKSEITVTVFIPAFNEEKNLVGAVEGAKGALEQVQPADYEIIILNANSTDSTGAIADAISADDPKVRVIHRDCWAGLGANYMEGVRHAAMEYYVMFPGDNENSWESMAECLELAGQADIIIPYTMNTEVRAWHRRIISNAFVQLMNFLFNLHLRYYNGNTIYRTVMLRELDVTSTDFAYNAEILIKLIRSGRSYKEHGIRISPTGKTAIFGLKNILSVLRTICRLFLDVKIKNRSRYHKSRLPGVTDQ